MHLTVERLTIQSTVRLEPHALRFLQSTKERLFLLAEIGIKATFTDYIENSTQAMLATINSHLAVLTKYTEQRLWKMLEEIAASSGWSGSSTKGHCVFQEHLESGQTITQRSLSKVHESDDKYRTYVESLTKTLTALYFMAEETEHLVYASVVFPFTSKLSEKLTRALSVSLL